jgi:hypothetical protein
VNVNDIVVNGWSSRLARVAHADPEMRARVAKVIDATGRLLKASSKELAAAIEEQNDAVAALKNYVSTAKLEKQAGKPAPATETSRDHRRQRHCAI